MNDKLLKALRCENQGRPPVWIMRQAGRYMPDYRKLRQKYSLWDLFHQPELAVEVTHLPLTLLNVDAAILFSDILVIAEVFGLKIIFPETGGPHLEHPIQHPEEISLLEKIDVVEVLHYVKTTIELLKPHLKVPLIGFCGAPFTVASYWTKKGGAPLRNTQSWIAEHNEAFHQLLQKITEASIDYLSMQIDAGVDAIQIFDSWADVLTNAQFFEFSFKYLKQMIDALKPRGVPIIIFCKGSSFREKELALLNPTAISFDWQREMSLIRQGVPSHIAVQGNLDPALLKQPLSLIEKRVCHLMNSMEKDPGFIMNLGHGVLPETPFEHVKAFVDCVLNRS